MDNSKLTVSTTENPHLTAMEVVVIEDMLNNAYKLINNGRYNEEEIVKLNGQYVANHHSFSKAMFGIVDYMAHSVVRQLMDVGVVMQTSNGILYTKEQLNSMWRQVAEGEEAEKSHVKFEFSFKST